MTRTNKIKKSHGFMARVIRTSNAITEGKRPRGYRDFSHQEMDVIIGAPLSADDYERAHRIMLLLMQPQVKCLLNSEPVGKRRAKNTQKGMFICPIGVSRPADCWT